MPHVLLSSGTGETNLAEAEALLEPYVAKFPNVSNRFIETHILSNGDILVSVCAILLTLFITAVTGCSNALLHCKNCSAQREFHLCELLKISAPEEKTVTGRKAAELQPFVYVCRRRKSSWHALQRRRSGVRSTTCATGN